MRREEKKCCEINSEKGSKRNAQQDAVKPLQECAKEGETIELYFQQGARRGGNNDGAANLLRWRVSEVDVPDFVVAY